LGQHGDVTHDLTRFTTAQDSDGTYARALEELRAGSKRSHWMWFVFPQVAGLGRSETAKFYALDGLTEARAYLADPVLGPRLLECALALTSLGTTDPVAVLGAVDAQKLRSSMTLFAKAAEHDEDRAVLQAVLDQYFAGAADPQTLVRLTP
jgi:uncharacterized protein (DUF1810 family)